MKIHFVGIKGVGVMPLALIAKDAGFTVTGSDLESEFITDIALKKAGIVPFIGFSKEHIGNPDLVITTGAHGGYDNIEVIAAREKKIKVITQGEAVGVFMTGTIFGKKFSGISVAGTHGKTTTTAMLATIFKQNQLDPSFVIGTGDIASLGASGHLGKGNIFIAEADEYATEPRYNKRAKLLWQNPKIAIITNIEYDHPDIYKTLDDIRQVYLEFSNKLPKNGVLIICGDDREIRKLIKEYHGNIITYGFNPDNNYVLDRVNNSGEHMFLSVKANGTTIGEFMLNVVGEHNGLNALAAIIAAYESGLSIEKIKKALPAFTGSKRRLEFIGELVTGAKVYDDYAHHPTEIKKTLQALRTQYPKKQIIGVFQPHTYSRTKKLFDEFCKSFNDINVIIITEIYKSLREVPDPTITSEILSESVKNKHKGVLYLPHLTDVVKYVNEKRFRSDTVLVTMGAGDVYMLHSQLKFL